MDLADMNIYLYMSKNPLGLVYRCAWREISGFGRVLDSLEGLTGMLFFLIFLRNINNR